MTLKAFAHGSARLLVEVSHDYVQPCFTTPDQVLKLGFPLRNRPLATQLTL
jgi:hypothetical protein